MRCRTRSQASFVTFAFAAADLLIAVGDDDAVRFAAGAARLFVGAPAEQLVGRSVVHLFAPDDYLLVRHLLRRARAGKRVGPVVVTSVTGAIARLRALADPTSDIVAVTLSDMRAARLAEGLSRPPLLRRDQLVAALDRLLAEAEGVVDPHLSLIDIKGFDRLSSRCGAQLVAELMAVLRAGSIDGQMAAELTPGRYAVVHEGQAAGEDLREEVRHLLAMVVEPGPLALDAVAIPLSEPTFGIRELSQAIAHLLGVFAAHGREAVSPSLAAALDAHLRATLERLDRLRASIEDLRFTLVFQPIVRLPERTAHHFEALIRFSQAGESPEATLQLAEKAGLVGQLDLRIVRRVLAELRQAPAEVRVAANLSARSIEDARFIAELLQILSKSDVDAIRLMFEITESHALVDMAHARSVLLHLRERGHMICLDDFGSGAAAFQYIRYLPADFVKLAGSFTKSVQASPRERTIVRSVVQLCRELGIQVVAENVETEEECRAMEELGVGFGQGFLFGAPRADFRGGPPASVRRGLAREEWA
ncbi:Cyclic di-GMP phosphodiesterase YfgF [bacterium HR40]|nr:Cyclic di-GMP phosphodiesterase YfgF [bacterium HR40]